MTDGLPEKMMLGGLSLFINDYLNLKSENFQQRHPERKEGFSCQDIEDMLILCIEGKDAPEETERWWDELLEEVCNDLYLTEQFNQQNMTTEVTPFLDQEIVSAAKNTTMAHGFKELLEKYDFGLDFVEITSRTGEEPTVRDLAACCGLGMSLGNSGQNLIAAAVARLLAQGGKMGDVVEQIGSVLKLKYATLSNYNRTYIRTPAEYKTLPFDVQKEIATSRYSSDEKEDEKIRLGLFKQAKENGWNSSEARSHRKMAQGQDVEITAGEAGKPATERLRYYYGLPGESVKHSKECPVFADNLFCIDVKDRTYLSLDGNKFVFLPMEKA